jgi:Tfp pilus assembly protein PilZ
MERRRNQRRVKHVQVRYWRHGDPAPHAAYSTDISPTGMFITTNQPLASGDRLRVEVSDQREMYMLEAVVARSTKVAPHLTSFRRSGMGVRFLTAEEIMSRVLGGGGTAKQASTTLEEVPPKNGVFPVRFGSVQQLIDTYQRDMATGGMFVTTRYPAALDERITVEVHLPSFGAGEPPPPMRFAARVVQRLDPGAGGDPNRPGGMGVEFLDRGGTLAQLAPIVQLLSRTAPGSG